MGKRIAVFVDWENVRKVFFEGASPSLDYNRPEILDHFIISFLESDEELFRIFLYVSEPVREAYYKGKQLDFSSHEAYKRHVEFIRNIGTQDYYAIRKGKLKFRGYKEGKPDFVQKGVDMLMGLDIAHVSYRRIVDRILILSADTDVIPAMKTARINGVQVVAGICKDIHIKVSLSELKVHADIVRERSIKEICYEWFRERFKKDIVPLLARKDMPVKTGFVVKRLSEWGIRKMDNEVINDFFSRLINETMVNIKPENPDNPFNGVLELKYPVE